MEMHGVVRPTANRTYTPLTRAHTHTHTGQLFFRCIWVHCSHANTSTVMTPIKAHCCNLIKCWKWLSCPVVYVCIAGSPLTAKSEFLFILPQRHRVFSHEGEPGEHFSTVLGVVLNIGTEHGLQHTHTGQLHAWHTTDLAAQLKAAIEKLKTQKWLPIQNMLSQGKHKLLL